MPKPRLLLDWIALDEHGPLPKYRQLYLELRTAIVSGRLSAQSVLPASRTLAKELGVSRNTVLNAYDQLLTEGYLEAREGSATVVASLRSNPAHVQGEQEKTLSGQVKSVSSQRGLEFLKPRGSALNLPDATAFTPGLPAFDRFPAQVWSRLLASQSRRMHPELADTEIHSGGYGPLRESLASYLRSSRMVVCDPDQIFVVSSAREALDLVCRLVADTGDSAIVEEPGYNIAKKIILAASLQIIRLPVDDNGMQIENNSKATPNAQIAYVTPSHQWPMSVTMSAARRQQLLDWAERQNAWVIEDDYDSEFRFDSRPVATLQSLDADRRVIYVGTFLKVLFPSLRTAYLVVPRPLIRVFRQGTYYSSQGPPLHLQAALAEFIEGGHFYSHIRRMRRIYKRRQTALVETLTEQLNSHLTIARPAGGMQMPLYLPANCPAEKVSSKAAIKGIHARPLSLYATSGNAPNGLHLGFAAVPDRQIEPSAKLLAEAILGV